MFRNVLIFLVAMGLLAVVTRWLKRPKKLFEARIAERDVLVLGPIPNRSQSELKQYLEGLRLPVGSRVVGIDTGKGDFKLLFSGSIREEDQRRVRAYLKPPDYLRPV